MGFLGMGGAVVVGLAVLAVVFVAGFGKKRAAPSRRSVPPAAPAEKSAPAKRPSRAPSEALEAEPQSQLPPAPGETDEESAPESEERLLDLDVPKPQLKVSGLSGATVGSSYWVRGKLLNAGHGTATGIVVKVRLLAGEDLLAEVDAEVSDSCEPGEKKRFEAAYSGAGIKRITDLEAILTWAEQGD